MRLRLFSLLLLWLPLALPAQFHQTIRGTLLDAVTRSPVEGVAVAAYREGVFVKGVYSDADGRFRLDSLPLGRYGIQFNLVGYVQQRRDNLILNAAKELVLEVLLEEDVVEMETVEITGEGEHSPRNEMTTVSARQFSIEDTRRYAGSWNDPARMASNFAGVNNDNDTRNDIIVRGNSPAGILWRLESVDIPNPNHFGAFGTTGGPVSILNNNTLDNSDFMTGAWPAEYGNAVSGVFDLRMRKGNDEQFEFLGQVGFNGLEMMAEGPLKKGSGASFMVNLRYATFSLFRALDIDFGSSAIPEYQDGSFKLVLPARKAGTFTWFGIGGMSTATILERERDSTDFFGPAGNDIVFGTRMGATGVSHSILLREKTSLKNTVSVSASHMGNVVDRVNRTTWTNTPFYRNSSNSQKASWAFQLNHKFSPRHSLRAGWYADRLSYQITDSIQIDTSFGFYTLTDFTGAAFLLQPYLQWKWRLSAAWTLNTGLHAQYFTYNHTRALEPRVGISWKIADKAGTLSAAVGQHAQIQPVFVYFAYDTLADGTQIYPNRDVDFTRSAQAVLSYDLPLGQRMRLKTEAYYQHLYSVPVEMLRSSSYTMLDQGADYYFVIPDSLNNDGTGQNYGVELTVEKFFHKHYYFLLTGSLYKSQYRGSDGILRSTRFDGGYTLHALGGYELEMGERKRSLLGIDGRVAWAGGRRYTPVDIVRSQFTVLPQYVSDSANALQFRPYLRCDLRLKYRLNSRKVTQEWALDISNIFDRQNPLDVIYDKQRQVLRYNYQLGFFPVVQYRVEF